MHLLQLSDRHVRIYLRGTDVRMAQHRLNVTDISSALEHERRHGMPPKMAAPALAYTGGVDSPSHERGQPQRS